MCVVPSCTTCAAARASRLASRKSWSPSEPKRLNWFRCDARSGRLTPRYPAIRVKKAPIKVPFLMLSVGMSNPSSRPRRPRAALPFDPATQPWQPADAGLTAIAPELLVPESLREVLSHADAWPQDPLGSTEYRHPGREGAPV